MSRAEWWRANRAAPPWPRSERIVTAEAPSMVGSALPFWGLANTVTTLLRLRQVAWGLTLMAVPIAVTAVRNFMSGTFVPGVAETSRIAGYDAPLTANPNELALLLNLIFPLSLGLFLISRKLLARTLLLGVIAADVLV